MCIPPWLAVVITALWAASLMGLWLSRRRLQQRNLALRAALAEMVARLLVRQPREDENHGVH